MSLRPDELKRVLAGADHPLGVKELLRLGGLSPGQQTALKQAMRELVRAGEVEKQGKRFALPGKRPEKKSPQVSAPRGRSAGRPAGRAGGRVAKAGPVVEGTLHLHRDGYGFVHPEGEGENVFVPPDQARRALDNDRVQVEVVPGRDGRTAGRLVKVLDRRRQLLIGTYVDRPKGSWVEPRDESISGNVRVPRTQMARDGDLVKVRLGVGAALLSPGEGLFGEVAGSLGKPGDPSVEVLSVAYSQGFNDEFPAEVMDEADAISIKVTAEEAHGVEGNAKRRDLRSMQLVTIDGEDARDFDDAIYVEDKPGGWRLVVAIADVTHYVKEGTPLDDEAFRRATSVYLPDRVLPMLPERLSNGICSLKPDEDRLCMVADMELSTAGELTSSEFYPGVMRSAARCTYGEVHRVLSGEDVPHRNAFKPLLERAMALSRALTAMRKLRGAIDFDLPESKVELDDEGKPSRMVRRERMESHRLVEECMLAANESVARFFQDKGLPSVYRYHAEPDEEKLQTFAALAGVFGFELGTKGGKVTSKDLNALLAKLAGHPEQKALNQLLLRSMMQAVYSADSHGHYGLAAENYLHFTSPIRRYPDLLVHRLLKANWRRHGKGRSTHELESETEKLTKMAAQSSERERAAMQVEREVVSFYAALMMNERVGEEFDATVSSLTDFGFFVELDELFIEGLVKGEAVDPNFRFDPLTYAMVFGSGRRVRVGAKLRVRLASVNLQRRQIDFTVVRFGDEPEAVGRRTSKRLRGTGRRTLERTGRRRGTRPGSARPGRSARRGCSTRPGRRKKRGRSTGLRLRSSSLRSRARRSPLRRTPGSIG
ncbi:MAG: ribonuclease R [Myxococcaceae bacterium]